MLDSTVIFAPGMLIISHLSLTRMSMLKVVGWMLMVTVSMLIIVQCMLSPLPRLHMLIVKVCMLFAAQSMLGPLPLPRVSMLILVHCMLIIDGGMLWPLPLPWMSLCSLGGHPCRSFQLKKKRYELLGQPAEIEKLSDNWEIVSLMVVNFRGCSPEGKLGTLGYHLTGSNSTSSKV